MSSTHKIITQKSIFCGGPCCYILLFAPPIFSLFLVHLQNVPAFCICFFCNLTFVSTPVYFRYVASLCVLAVVGFLGSDLTTPGPRCEVFDDDDEARCELVFRYWVLVWVPSTPISSEYSAST